MEQVIEFLSNWKLWVMFFVWFAMGSSLRYFLDADDKRKLRHEANQHDLSADEHVRELRYQTALLELLVKNMEAVARIALGVLTVTFIFIIFE